MTVHGSFRKFSFVRSDRLGQCATVSPTHQQYPVGQIATRQFENPNPSSNPNPNINPNDKKPRPNLKSLLALVLTLTPFDSNRFAVGIALSK